MKLFSKKGKKLPKGNPESHLVLARINRGYSVQRGREKSYETVRFNDALNHMAPVKLVLTKK